MMMMVVVAVVVMVMRAACNSALDGWKDGCMEGERMEARPLSDRCPEATEATQKPSGREVWGD